MDRREFLGRAGRAVLPRVNNAAPLRADGFRPPAAAKPRSNATFERIFQERCGPDGHPPSSASTRRAGAAAVAARHPPGGPGAAPEEAAAEPTSSSAVSRRYLKPDVASCGTHTAKWFCGTCGQQCRAEAVRIPTASPYQVSQQEGSYSRSDFLHSAHTSTTPRMPRPIWHASTSSRQFSTMRRGDERQAGRGHAAPDWASTGAEAAARVRAPAPERAPWRFRRQPPGPRTIPVTGEARRQDRHRQSLSGDGIANCRAGGASPTTRPGDGIWRVPNGGRDLAPPRGRGDHHQLQRRRNSPDWPAASGRDQCDLDKILRSAGLTRGTVGERLTALNSRPEQLYPNTDAGREQLIADLNQGVKAMYAKLPQAFGTLPKQPLEIRRVPPEIQDGASGGYYRQATLDGSRPAIYFINLKSTGDWPKYSLPR